MILDFECHGEKYGTLKKNYSPLIYNATILNAMILLLDIQNSKGKKTKQYGTSLCFLIN